MSLNVLVLESERGAADDTIRDLEAAGHSVVRCHEGGVPAFPCAGLTSGQCPLEAGAVDVAVTVRRRPRSQPAPQEDGVSCALRAHVPLVVAGATALNPFDDFATVIVDGTDAVVDACERAAVAELYPHCETATRALIGVFETHDVRDVMARVVVRRVRGGLRVVVRSDRPLEHRVQSVAAVRMIAALRAIDHDARGIDVSYELV
jgi:hypothetical protein